MHLRLDKLFKHVNVISYMATEKATFGAGCFWHVEEAFRTVKGVTKTEVGFMGGSMKNPPYLVVATGLTGHVEVCQVTFDPKVVSYKKLVDVYWKSHDPTQVNRQGPDVGSQYRSVVFYHNQKQKEEAEKSKEALIKSKKYDKPVATKIEKAGSFYKASEHHQKYLMKRGIKTC